MDTLRTKKQVAALFQCSERKIEKMMAAGQIPFVKIGSLVRFRESDLEKLVVNFVGTLGTNKGEQERRGPKAPVENSDTYGSVRSGAKTH